MSGEPLSGVFAPVLTPFDKSLAPDRRRFVAFCRWLLGQGAGLAVFGTNSEANSLSLAERLELLGVLIDAGLPAGRMMPGTGSCALPDAVTLCAAAAKAKTAAVLMLPPFYYKPLTDEALFAFYAEVIERVGDADLRVCLYHIPQVSGVPITEGLIALLRKRYPGTFVGLKDSGGDFAYTRSLLARFEGFRVFCGSERFLLQTLSHGGAGCISAGANVNPAAIVAAASSGGDPARQQSLNVIRDTLEAYPMIAALKYTVSHYGACEAFRTPRPPLLPLDERRGSELIARLEVLGFAMPGLARLLAS
jgi:4-hydroxy-tetrahydrodipicolinate synthase